MRFFFAVLCMTVLYLGCFLAFAYLVGFVRY
jgi:hypothetical protein